MNGEQKTSRIYRFLTKAYYSLTVLMALVVLILLILNVCMIVESIPNVIVSNSKNTLNDLIADILTFFVLIELTRAFTDYLAYHRVRLSLMAEVASIFVLREILIKLYIGEYDWPTLISFSVLITSLVLVRVLCLKYSPNR